VSRLLDTFYDGEIEVADFISSIKKKTYDFEIVFILLCELYKLNLVIYYQKPELGSGSFRVALDKFQVDCGENQTAMFSLLPFEANNSGSATLDVSRSINTVYDQKYIDRAALVQTLIYEVLDKVVCEDESDEEDEFEFENFEQDEDTVMVYSNAELKHWKQAEKDKKHKISGMKLARSATLKKEAEISSKPLDVIKEDNSNQATPVTANSSYSGSTKTIGLRSKLNPKSSIYNANQSKSPGMPPAKPKQFTNPSKMAHSQQNVVGSSQRVVPSNIGNYHQSFNQFNSGLLSQMPPQFHQDRYGVRQPTVPTHTHSSENLNHPKFGNLSTPFSMGRNSEQKSKSHMIQNTLKFSSDVNITSKHFTLFGDLEEVESSNQHLESDSEDDSRRMAKCLPNDILDDSDFHTPFGGPNQKFLNTGVVQEKEYD
jgi:hypothetical protein